MANEPTRERYQVFLRGYMDYRYRTLTTERWYSMSNYEWNKLVAWVDKATVKIPSPFTSFNQLTLPLEKVTPHD